MNWDISSLSLCYFPPRSENDFALRIQSPRVVLARSRPFLPYSLLAIALSPAKSASPFDESGGRIVEDLGVFVG